MNKIYFVMIILFFSVFLIGCHNNKKQIVESVSNVTTIIIPEALYADDVSIIEDQSHIILESKEDAFWGGVSKMRVYKNRIIVLDAIHAQAIFIYTKEGKHIVTIGANKGRGPLEFISVSNFEIDYANDQLLVMDNWGFKFMIYDLDGRFIKRVESKIGVTNAVLLPNGYIMHAKSSSDHKIPGQGISSIIIVDDHNRIVKKGFEYDDNEGLAYRIYDIIRSQFNIGFTFAPQFRDTIYSVSYDSISPKYALDFRNYSAISKRQIGGMTSNAELNTLFNEGKTCFMGTHVESDEILFVTIGGFRNPTYVFYNKVTGSTIAIFRIVEPRIVPYTYELYKILCSDEEGYFYGAFNQTQLREISQLFPELQAIDPVSELNPIVFRYKIKI